MAKRLWVTDIPGATGGRRPDRDVSAVYARRLAVSRCRPSVRADMAAGRCSQVLPPAYIIHRQCATPTVQDIDIVSSCTRAFLGVVFWRPEPPRRRTCRAPHLLGPFAEKGPKFDIIPELLGGFRGIFSCRIFLTWGNACIRGCFSPFSPAKPPRSSDNPIAVA